MDSGWCERARAKGRVSVKWQIAMTVFLPIGILAFFRIYRLRRYTGMVLVPWIAVSLGLLAAGEYERMLEDSLGASTGVERALAPGFDPAPYVRADITSYIAFLLIAAYLAARWSRNWNQQRL